MTSNDTESERSCEWNKRENKKKRKKKKKDTPFDKMNTEQVAMTRDTWIRWFRQ